MKIINELYNAYVKLSSIAKIIFWIFVFLLSIQIFKTFSINGNGKGNIESFQQDDDFLFIEGDKVYDDFYASIYDNLVYSNIKNSYEIGEIVNKTTPTTESIILDVGCGTGHHISKLMDMGFENSIGVDKSTAMIKRAKENYPQYNFMVGDVLRSSTFQPQSFTHILCLYFSIYYLKNKELFFQNCYSWLMPGGYVVVHLVDRSKFDPILPPSNPLYLVSPQRYAKERITSSKVSFNDFEYQGNFVLNENTNTARFVEKFSGKTTNKRRRQEHIMYMEDTHSILQLAQNVGFIINGQIDLINVSYEYQYLYILQKPE